MVDREREREGEPCDHEVIEDDRALLETTGGDDDALGRIENGLETINTKGTEVGERGAGMGKVGWMGLMVAAALQDGEALDGDLGERLLGGVSNNRRE